MSRHTKSNDKRSKNSSIVQTNFFKKCELSDEYEVIASNYELYNLQSTFQRFLYTLLNEKFISFFPLFSSLFSSLFFKFLANQRQDKYSLAHAHSTDAHIHTYGQYMMCAVHSVLYTYTDAIN